MKFEGLVIKVAWMSLVIYENVRGEIGGLNKWSLDNECNSENRKAKLAE